MALITDHEAPPDVPTTDALDDVRADLAAQETAPAFLTFGRSHAELADPPERGEIRTYLVRARCKGVHTTERADGEVRHSRSLEIICCWLEGTPKPPDADEQQPGLFDRDDEDQDQENEDADDEEQKP